jgi:GNAT superfamily N-acetyltransferase
MTTLKTQKNKYKSIFADAAHQPITSIRQFENKYDQYTLGFFRTGQVIGTGDLLRCEYRKDRGYLQTESVRLRKGFRRKGHGIHLYTHLIETARKIGATRIYSSTNLNKYSRRMWSVKLPRIYKVVTVFTNKPCDCCTRKTRRELGYYIVL